MKTFSKQILSILSRSQIFPYFSTIVFNRRNSALFLDSSWARKKSALWRMLGRAQYLLQMMSYSASIVRKEFSLRFDPVFILRKRFVLKFTSALASFTGLNKWILIYSLYSTGSKEISILLKGLRARQKFS